MKKVCVTLIVFVLLLTTVSCSKNNRKVSKLLLWESGI